MTAYHFAMSKIGRASRDIWKLEIENPNGTDLIYDEDIVQHMTDKYTKIAAPDPVAGSMSIEEFLGHGIKKNRVHQVLFV